MNRNLAIGIGAAVIILLVGAFAFMQMNKAKTTGQEANVFEQTNQSSDDSTQSSSLKNLIAGGKSVKCDVTYTDGKGKGTVYVASDKKFRGDFDITVAGAPSAISHMISDGTYSYMWAEGSNQGTKFKTDAAQASGSPAPQGQANLDQAVNTKCSGWTTDNSMFTPPTTVTFTDFSAVMQKSSAPQTGGSVSTPTNSICNSVTDPTAKAACLKSTSGY